MSRVHRFGRSLAVASVALILVAGAAFAHDAVVDPSTGGGAIGDGRRRSRPFQTPDAEEQGGDAAENDADLDHFQQGRRQRAGGRTGREGRSARAGRRQRRPGRGHHGDQGDVDKPGGQARDATTRRRRSGITRTRTAPTRTTITKATTTRVTATTVAVTRVAASRTTDRSRSEPSSAAHRIGRQGPSPVRCLAYLGDDAPRWAGHAVAEQPQRP